MMIALATRRARRGKRPKRIAAVEMQMSKNPFETAEILARGLSRGSKAKGFTVVEAP